MGKKSLGLFQVRICFKESDRMKKRFKKIMLSEENTI